MKSLETVYPEYAEHDDEEEIREIPKHNLKSESLTIEELTA
jgi:hypothetical protein